MGIESQQKKKHVCECVVSVGRRTLASKRAKKKIGDMCVVSQDIVLQKFRMGI